MEGKNIKDIFSLIKKKIWFIIILTIIPIVISGIFSLYSYDKKPEYKATKTLLVGGPKAYFNTDDELDYETYKTINGKLLSHFNELVKMDVVVGEVIENLDLDMSYKGFKDKMNVEIIDKTELIKIEVKNKDPELATKIVDEVINVSLNKADEIIGIQNVQVVDEVQVVALPVKQKAKTNMSISGMLGFVLSILIIFLLEDLNTTIKDERDIEKYLGLPVSGVLPRSEKSLIFYEEPNSFTAEFYRSLRTNIQNLKKDKEIKLIHITSVDINDRKNLIASNIAIAIAKTQKKVLLIDGNMRMPEVHSLFEVDNNHGLSDVLNENIDYKEAIKKVEVEKNLDILTSGTSTSNPAELLASNKMKNLLEKVKSEYDAVIINSPSLGIVTDATIISTIVEGTFLVSTSGVSNIDEVKRGMKILKKVNINILGAILDNVDIGKNDYFKHYLDIYNYNH